jgi:HlyD family secretion protein
MTANVKILTNKEDDVLKIPNAALRFRPPEAKPDSIVRAAGRRQENGSTVWILDQDGKPKPVKVKLGITDGNFTAVDGGDLKEGARVIVGSTIKTPSGNPSGPRPRGPGF